MSFLDFLRRKPAPLGEPGEQPPPAPAAEERPRTGPEAETGGEPLSFYEQIAAAAGEDGLRSDFSLEKPAGEEGGVRFADGARDGIAMYHMDLSGKDDSPLHELLALIAAGYIPAEQRLEEFFVPGGPAMLPLIDGMQSWIMEHREELDPHRMSAFCARLLRESRNPECVKFALSVLELLDVEEDEELCRSVRTLALSDEFTLFCSYVIRGWRDGGLELFRLAQKVRGWGRVFLVEQLEPDSPEVRDWLLREGWRNDIMPDYSAARCARKGGLGELLAREELGREDYAAARDLVAALLPEGPRPGISALEDGERLLGDYLRHAGRMAGSLRDYEVLGELEEYLEGSGLEGRAVLLEQCGGLLRSPRCLERTREAMEEGRGFALGRRLGLPYGEPALRQIQRDPRGSFSLVDLLLPQGLFAEEIFDLYSREFPLDRMASGPAEELGLGTGWEDHRLLGYMVQRLGDFPGMGEPLLLCALASPVVSSRNMGLNTAAAWREKGPGLSPAVAAALEALKKTEVDADLQKRLEEF